MPKAVGISQNPSSPGSLGTASTSAAAVNPPASTERRGSGRPSNEAVSSRGAVGSASARNGRARSFPSFDSWPPDLDDSLKAIVSSASNGEREAISAIRVWHPELSEELIWSRIVYLGLTDRTRRPYQKHEWTDREDQILRAEYGRTRACSRDAINKILELHPGWSRDAVVWRARVLKLTQHRVTPPERWSSTHDHFLLSLMGCQLDTVARRLDRSKKSVLARLRRLGWGADFFGGFKTKDLVFDLRVSEDLVNGWVHRGWLERKKGRITEESLRWLCRHHPEEIPFETLAPVTQNWLMLSMDYGRGAVIRHGGRRKKSPSEDGAASSQNSSAAVTL
jgi:hypothetical protein